MNIKTYICKKCKNTKDNYEHWYQETIDGITYRKYVALNKYTEGYEDLCQWLYYELVKSRGEVSLEKTKNKILNEEVMTTSLLEATEFENQDAMAIRLDKSVRTINGWVKSGKVVKTEDWKWKLAN